MISDFNQCSDSRLDYRVDWSQWLDDDDEIVTSVWSAPDDLTVVTDSLMDAITTIWLTGGQSGQTYTIKNTITTRMSRIHCRSFRLGILSD